jgi:hypothetical protein
LKTYAAVRKTLPPPSPAHPFTHATVMLRNARLRNEQPITGGVLIACPCLGISARHVHVGRILMLFGSCANRGRVQYGLVRYMCQVFVRLFYLPVCVEANNILWRLWLVGPTLFCPLVHCSSILCTITVKCKYLVAFCR